MGSTLFYNLKRRAFAFIARIGLKKLLLFIFFPYGIVNYIINGKYIFKQQKYLLKNLFNPMWCLVFSTLLIKRLKRVNSFLCISILNRLIFVALDSGSLYVYFHIWIASDYEKIAKPAGGIIVDVGAHIGLFTLRTLITFRSDFVIAIEPNPKFVKLLHENIILNKFENKVKIISACAGKRKGKRKFFVNDEEGISSIQPLSDRYIIVDEVVLDEELGSLKIDFIKIDVEGAELEVIEGLRNLLLKYKPVLVIEVSKNNLLSLLKYFKKIGYKTKLLPYGEMLYHITAIRQR